MNVFLVCWLISTRFLQSVVWSGPWAQRWISAKGCWCAIKSVWNSPVYGICKDSLWTRHTSMWEHIWHESYLKAWCYKYKEKSVSWFFSMCSVYLCCLLSLPSVKVPLAEQYWITILLLCIMYFAVPHSKTLPCLLVFTKVNKEVPFVWACSESIQCSRCPVRCLRLQQWSLEWCWKWNWP